MAFYVHRLQKKKQKKQEAEPKYLAIANYDENKIMALAQEELEKQFPGQKVFAPETLGVKIKGLKNQVSISVVKKKISEKLRREIAEAKEESNKNGSLR
jgi:hypothetical protein